MAQGPSDTILVAIRITLRIPESKVRNPDPQDVIKRTASVTIKNKSFTVTMQLALSYPQM